MKPYILALLAAVAGVLAFQSGVSALTTTQYTTKPVSVTIQITPSPAPVGFAPVHTGTPPAQPADVPDLGFARYIAEPEALLAGLGTQVAQVQSAPGGNVPVNITVKPDPTAAYLHITPVTPVLNAGYGMNTFTCAYRVFGYFTKTWKIDDWVYNSTTSSNFGFPVYGYPATSAASWSAEGISTAYSPYTNTGTPGQLTFTGNANVSQDVCIDIQVNVTPDVAAGSYPLTVTYALYVTF